MQRTKHIIEICIILMPNVTIIKPNVYVSTKKGKFLRRPKGTQKKEKKVMKILTQGGFTPAGSVSARIVCESKLIFGNTKY